MFSFRCVDLLLLFTITQTTFATVIQKEFRYKTRSLRECYPKVHVIFLAFFFTKEDPEEERRKVQQTNNEHIHLVLLELK